MVDLNPPHQQLGFSSPVLGPWFSDAGISLPAPGNNLSIEMQSGFEWLPPAAGVLSLYVKNGVTKTALAGLKGADASPAFTNGSLVALFRLLPEVEERLDALLSDFIPSADGRAVDNGVQRRARIRHLALEIVGGATAIDPAVWDVDPPAASHSADPEAQAAHLGLQLTGDGLTNNDRPMRDLKRPGRFTINGSSAMQVMLKVGNTDGVFLWAFDDKGLAVDPGAVAEWWKVLAQEKFENKTLWAPGLEPDELNTAESQDVHTAHLVNPHEGPAPEELTGAVTSTNMEASGNLWTHDPVTSTAQMALPAGQANQPKRIALLPNGTYAQSLGLWPTGDTFPSRDFVRVALVDLDRHLVGPQADANAPEVVAGVRPTPRPDSGNVLRDSIDAAAAELVDVLDGDGERHLATSVLSADFGPFPAAEGPLIEDFPNSLVDPTVTALTGGGTAAGDTVTEQRVLVDITVAPEFAGAWVRAWPHGFDGDTAKHIRLNGGGAPVRENGVATLVITLPGGSLSSLAQMGMDVLLSTPLASRFYSDLRHNRPAPVGGSAISIESASGPFTVCETGQIAANESDLTNPGRVPPGATVVSRGAQPALIDPQSLGPQHLNDGAVLSRLSQGVSVSLTEPAFRRSLRGATVGSLSALGAKVEEVTRNGLEAVFVAGAPLPGQERLDVAAGRLDGQDARAAIATAPALSRYHERLPHQSGHPGVPATDELHGTGAVLSGQSALPAIEYLRDRTARRTLPDLFNAARILLPDIPAPQAPARWTALLRTVSPGVEGEPGLGIFAKEAGFQFGQELQNILSSLAGLPGGIPPGISAQIPEAQAVARALDRRIFTARDGLTDALTSVREALGRAEHFVYIETPAADHLDIEGEDLSVWSALIDRMGTRPSLRALVCFPVHLMPGTPLRLEQVRNKLIADLPLADGRIQLMSVNAGAGRSLRQSSTTVIVDDAFAMTGTAHLWRRGMTFDSSISVAVFDEELDRGRPREIRAFRRSLIAGRLGLKPSQLPEDPDELLLGIRQLSKRGGGHRLAVERIVTRELEPTKDDPTVWNRDGRAGENLADWINELFTLIQSGPLQEALGDEVSTPSG